MKTIKLPLQIVRNAYGVLISDANHEVLAVMGMKLTAPQQEQLAQAVASGLTQHFTAPEDMAQGA